MRRTLLFCLVALCAITSAFAQTSKDVLAFRLKTAIASSTLMSFDVNSPEEEFYVDWGDGFKKRYTAGSYTYPNPVYSSSHKEEIKIYGTGISSISFSTAKLTELEILDATALTSLNCSGGTLKSLDITEATKLTSLDASNNEITDINLSKARKLTSLIMSNNKLTSVDLTNCWVLTELSLDNNALTGTFAPEGQKLNNLTLTTTS